MRFSLLNFGFDASIDYKDRYDLQVKVCFEFQGGGKSSISSEPKLWSFTSQARHGRSIDKGRPILPTLGNSSTTKGT